MSLNGVRNVFFGVIMVIVDLITLWFEVNRRTLTSIQINTERNIHIHKFRLPSFRISVRTHNCFFDQNGL